jgi:hypothetical protein
MDFTNSTLQNITKKAKLLKKENSQFTLFQSKDKISINLGFKSFNDLKKHYDEWSYKKEIVLIFYKNDIATFKYKLTNNSEITHIKKLFVDDINHTKNFNLKRILDVKEINEIKSKLLSSTYYIDSLVYFKMPSKRIDLIKLEKEFIKKEENAFYVKINAYKELFYEEIPYIIKNYLIEYYKNKKPKIQENSTFEDVEFFPRYCFVDNKIFNFSYLYEEDIYDYTQPIDSDWSM